MPTYKSAGVTVTLATTNLKDSISATASLSKTKGPPDLKRVNAALEQTTTPLKEIAVIDDANPGPLRFLGSRGDAPHFLVQVRDPAHTISFGQFPPIRITPFKDRLLAKSLPSDNHRALVLHVDLSKCTSWSRKLLHDRDIKIEVFLNGEFCGCRLISGQNSYDAWNCPTKVQIFAGNRVSRQHERPWVLAQDSAAVPNSNGPAHNHDISPALSIVSNRLLEEVRLRGSNQYGERSPVSDYLTSLAEFAPATLRSGSMSSKQPGIIDVVISFGHGKKDGSDKGHMSEPERLRGNGYPPMVQTTSTDPHSLPRTLEPTGKNSFPLPAGGLGVPQSDLDGAQSDVGAQDITAQLQSRSSLSNVQNDKSSSKDLPSEKTDVTARVSAPSRRHYLSMDQLLSPGQSTPFETTNLMTRFASSPESQPLADLAVNPTPRLDSVQPGNTTDSPSVQQVILVSLTTSPLTSYAQSGWSTPASALARRGIVLPPKGLEGNHTRARSTHISIDSMLNPVGSSSPTTQPPALITQVQGSDGDVVMTDAQPIAPRRSARSQSQKVHAARTPTTITTELAMPPPPLKSIQDDRRDSGMYWECTKTRGASNSPVAHRNDRNSAAGPPVSPTIGLSLPATVNLDEDSVFTLAKPEMVSKDGVLPDGRTEVLRQVRKERHGAFEEESILCGVRFVML